jgi:hypothetical protein
MQTRCARFPVAGLGLRCSVSGPRPWGMRVREIRPSPHLLSRPRTEGGTRSSVLGVRSAALICIRYQVSGPRYRYLSSKKPHTGYARCRIWFPFPSCRLHTPWARFSEHEPGIPPYPGLLLRYRDSARVPGLRSRVPGTRHRSRIDAEGRIPSTEDRAQRAPRVCILHPASLTW